jgi:leucyl/phenylalanyl-tRNA--protein transferase
MLSPDILLRAYAVGLFPMAEHHDESALYWIDPEKRGILPIERFRIPRRLRKTVRQNRFRIQCDTAFEDVIRLCAKPTKERKDTWINQEIIQLYINLFEIGRAHSVEAWLNGKLVGGLYGVALGGAFFGESMFSRADDASKVALVHLVARLKLGGFTLLDTQFVTNHLNQFGAAEIHRSGYRHLLSSALDKSAFFKQEIDHREILDFIQSTTHIS